MSVARTEKHVPRYIRKHSLNTMANVYGFSPLEHPALHTFSIPEEPEENGKQFGDALKRNFAGENQFTVIIRFHEFPLHAYLPPLPAESARQSVHDLRKRSDMKDMFS